MKILLGVTGGVAAKLMRKIVEKIMEAGHEVQIVATEKSFYFWKEVGLAALKEKVKVWRDHDEWKGYNYDPDIPIAHIELSKWADIFLLVPLTANTLSKIANGLADNLLTCVARAWWEPDGPKPLVVAPAMNTRMWVHPVTQEHVEKLRGWYGDKFKLVPPVSKKLACGETGVGALADIDDIVRAVNI